MKITCFITVCACLSSTVSTDEIKHLNRIRKARSQEELSLKDTLSEREINRIPELHPNVLSVLRGSRTPVRMEKPKKTRDQFQSDTQHQQQQPQQQQQQQRHYNRPRSKRLMKRLKTRSVLGTSLELDGNQLAEPDSIDHETHHEAHHEDSIRIEPVLRVTKKQNVLDSIVDIVRQLLYPSKNEPGPLVGPIQIPGAGRKIYLRLMEPVQASHVMVRFITQVPVPTADVETKPVFQIPPVVHPANVILHHVHGHGHGHHVLSSSDTHGDSSNHYRVVHSPPRNVNFSASSKGRNPPSQTGKPAVLPNSSSPKNLPKDPPGDTRDASDKGQQLAVDPSDLYYQHESAENIVKDLLNDTSPTIQAPTIQVGNADHGTKKLPEKSWYQLTTHRLPLRQITPLYPLASGTEHTESSSSSSYAADTYKVPSDVLTGPSPYASSSYEQYNDANSAPGFTASSYDYQQYNAPSSYSMSHGSKPADNHDVPSTFSTPYPQQNKFNGASSFYPAQNEFDSVPSSYSASSEAQNDLLSAPSSYSSSYERDSVQPSSDSYERGSVQPSSSSYERGSAQPSSSSYERGLIQPSSSSYERGLIQPSSSSYERGLAQPSSSSYERGSVQPSSSSYERGSVQPSSSSYERGLVQPSSSSYERGSVQASSSSYERGSVQPSSSSYERGLVQPSSSSREKQNGIWTTSRPQPHAASYEKENSGQSGSSTHDALHIIDPPYFSGHRQSSEDQDANRSFERTAVQRSRYNSHSINDVISSTGQSGESSVEQVIWGQAKQQKSESPTSFQKSLEISSEVEDSHQRWQPVTFAQKNADWHEAFADLTRSAESDDYRETTRHQRQQQQQTRQQQQQHRQKQQQRQRQKVADWPRKSSSERNKRRDQRQNSAKAAVTPSQRCEDEDDECELTKVTTTSTPLRSTEKMTRIVAEEARSDTDSIDEVMPELATASNNVIETDTPKLDANTEIPTTSTTKRTTTSTTTEKPSPPIRTTKNSPAANNVTERPPLSRTTKGPSAKSTTEKSLIRTTKNPAAKGKVIKPIATDATDSEKARSTSDTPEESSMESRTRIAAPANTIKKSTLPKPTRPMIMKKSMFIMKRLEVSSTTRRPTTTTTTTTSGTTTKKTTLTTRTSKFRSARTKSRTT